MPCPYIFVDAEQEELNEIFGSLSDYEDEELVDMTDWVKHRTNLDEKLK
ncbi:MAG: hypothetical protein U7127_03525 [Phormidium sp.]